MPHMRGSKKKGAQKEMIRNEIFGWLLKFWIIAVIGFLLFCLGRYFNHFPKHDERHAVKTTEAAKEFNENLVELEQNATEVGYNIYKAKELLFPPAVSKKRLPGIGGVRSIKDTPFVFGGEAHKTTLPAEVEMYEAVKNAGNSYEILRRVK